MELSLFSLVGLETLNNFLASVIQDNNNSQFFTGIVGVILGAFLTYFSALMIEHRREKTEKKKDKELRKRIASLISYELDHYSQYLKILDRELRNGLDKEGFLFNLGTLTQYYKNMIPETKAKVFDTNTLTKVEKAYRDIQLYVANIDSLIRTIIFEKDKASSKDSLGSLIEYR